MTNRLNNPTGGFFNHKPSPDGDGHPSVDIMRSLADTLIEELKLHEESEHEGKTCMTERVSTIAYLGHCLGLKKGDGPAVDHFLNLYHEAHKHGHDTVQEFIDNAHDD